MGTQCIEGQEHPSHPIISTTGLIMDYNDQTRALNGVDLEVEPGEWLTIMGPSGSGKTTLMNLIGGLLQPTAGRIAVEEVDIGSLSPRELVSFRREKIGFIFQQFHLIPYLNALENVMLSMYFHSLADEEEAREALRRVGLAHRAHHLPSQMSGGEQQRVAVARALVNSPQVLLADEPTGNLDQDNGQTILELMRELHQEGHTIVLITHEPTIAELGDRTIRLVDGRVEGAAQGTSTGNEEPKHPELSELSEQPEEPEDPENNQNTPTKEEQHDDQ